MSIHRTAAKRDASEPAIVEALVRAGASVHRISARDVPDLLVGWRGRNLLMEVKTPPPPLKRPPKRPRPDQRTEGQRLWASAWRGDAPHVVCTPQEALAILLAPEGT